MHAHLGGFWDKPNTESEPGKARGLVKGNLKEMPHNKSDQDYHKDMTLSPSLAVCLSTGTALFFFPPNKHLGFPGGRTRLPVLET